MDSEIKILSLGNAGQIHPINIYLHKNGTVTYKHTDGRIFESLEAFKKEYRRKFKKDVKFI